MSAGFPVQTTTSDRRARRRDGRPDPVAPRDRTARRIVVDGDPVEALQQVLTDLLREGLIRVCRGVDCRLDEPLVEVEALDLLKDPHWYSFHLDEPSETRVTYINVENIRPEFR